MKLCTKCGMAPRTERSSWCLSCRAELKRKYYQENREKVLAQSHAHNASHKGKIAAHVRQWRRAGVTVEEYFTLFARQGGLCAICQRRPEPNKTLAVDHDHKCCFGRKACGKCIRGLLCTRCNV